MIHIQDSSARTVTLDSGVSNNEYFVELLFGQEACFVSKAAVHLMKLVHQVLKVCFFFELRGKGTP